MKMAEVTSVDVCQESSMGVFYKKKECADNNRPLWKIRPFLLKISFFTSVPVQCYRVYHRGVIIVSSNAGQCVRGCNSRTEFLVNEDEMKSSVYDGAEFTTQGNNKRVDPYHPLAYKILRLGCVNLNLGEVQPFAKYQLEYCICLIPPSVPTICVSLRTII